MLTGRRWGIDMPDPITEIDITITSKDIAYLRKVVSDVAEPVKIDFLAAKLRERIIRTRKVNFAERLIKVYDAANDFEVGDHIFRHFGKVRTSQRRNVDFDDYAEGEVYEKILQQDKDYDLICVEWQDPVLRRQAKFLSKAGAQQYLPVRYGRAQRTVTRYLGPDKTERKRDEVIEQHRENLLRQIRGRVVHELYGQAEFVSWGPLWYLIDLLEEIDYELIEKAGAILEAEDGAVSTERLVNDLFALTPDSPRFLHYRFSLNYMMENFFSENFYCLSHFAGGAWTSRTKVPKDFGSRPLRLASAKVPADIYKREFRLPDDRLDERLAEILHEEEEKLATRIDGDNLVHVLTYNELVTGTLDVEVEAAAFFPEDTRIVFIAGGEEYQTTYHYESGFVVGLGDCYQEVGLVPGAILEIQRTETPTRFELGYVKSDQHLHYPRIEYDEAADLVHVKRGSERTCDCEVESHAFVPAGDINQIEKLRGRMKIDVSLYDVLVTFFKEYRPSFHPVTLWRATNIIRAADFRSVFSALTAFKSFYQIEEEAVDEYHLSPTQVGYGNIKKGVSSGDFIRSERRPVEEGSRVCRPKTYIVNLEEKHWAVASDYHLLPISHETEHIEIRRHDRAVVVIDGEIQAAAQVVTSKERLNPRLQTRFNHPAFISSVDIEVLGEGACEEIEIYHVPDPGVFVELEAETFEELMEHYAEVGEVVEA
ncbi:MAG: hypothetical protein CME06_06605 [Gemmatimonadetes bacterium]|nr:hypothetical protein [Gemmatimonadota bacterium]